MYPNIQVDSPEKTEEQIKKYNNKARSNASDRVR